MALATVTQVKVLISTNLTDATIESLIDEASDMLTAWGLTPTAQLEKWLTAHLISSVKERLTMEEKLGEAQVKYIGAYAGQFGEGLRSTHYGQMLITLDTSGMLAKIGKKAVYIKAIESFDETTDTD